MFMEFKDYFGNPVFVKKEDIVAVRADVQQYSKGDKTSIILTNGGHQIQVQGNVNMVMREIAMCDKGIEETMF